MYPVQKISGSVKDNSEVECCVLSHGHAYALPIQTESSEATAYEACSR